MGDLLYEVRDGAAWLTINREAQRNAISGEMLDLFNEHLDRADADDGVKTVDGRPRRPLGFRPGR